MLQVLCNFSLFSAGSYTPCGQGSFLIIICFFHAAWRGTINVCWFWRKQITKKLGALLIHRYDTQEHLVLDHQEMTWVRRKKKATYAPKDLNMLRVSSFAEKETDFKQWLLPTFNQRLAAYRIPSASTCHGCFLRQVQRCAIYTPCLQTAKTEGWRSPASWGER